jgi:hypothetical protein
MESSRKWAGSHTTCPWKNRINEFLTFISLTWLLPSRASSVSESITIDGRCSQADSQFLLHHGCTHVISRFRNQKNTQWLNRDQSCPNNSVNTSTGKKFSVTCIMSQQGSQAVKFPFFGSRTNARFPLIEEPCICKWFASYTIRSSIASASVGSVMCWCQSATELGCKDSSRYSISTIQ